MADDDIAMSLHQHLHRVASRSQWLSFALAPTSRSMCFVQRKNALLTVKSFATPRTGNVDCSLAFQTAAQSTALRSKEIFVTSKAGKCDGLLHTTSLDCLFAFESKLFWVTAVFRSLSVRYRCLGSGFHGFDLRGTDGERCRAWCIPRERHCCRDIRDGKGTEWRPRCTEYTSTSVFGAPGREDCFRRGNARGDCGIINRNVERGRGGGRGASSEWCETFFK